jgi:6-phosphogluconate dehydrogenase
VDAILDTASQKGTGKWTSVNALDLGIPANAIAAAVFARFLSALKDERVTAAQQLSGPQPSFNGAHDDLSAALHDALYCAKMCAYAQGFQLMRAAQQAYDWELDMAVIARIWRGGCIIRARLLQKIAEAYTRDPKLVNVLLDPYFSSQISQRQGHWRQVVALAAQHGIAVPGLMSTLSYYDGYRAAYVPANLIQAQRDYFGAHTYERTDQPRGTFFHLDWPAAERRQMVMD